MTATGPLPSLFGRFTAILREHDHLRGTLGRLRVMCSELERDANPGFETSPSCVLDELRTDLAAHFAAEEGRDYFGTVVDEAPQLALQVDELKFEHAAMLARVDELIVLAADARGWQSVPAPARALIAMLERHERSESVLLRGLFKGGE